MNLNSPKTAYLLFFLSGVASLMYEIVWGRLLILIFGSTTNSIVAVVSAFLGGLAIGSLVLGKVADRLKPSTLIKTYALLELGVAITSALTLFLIPALRSFYGNFSDGSIVTLELLITKFFLSALIILIPTILMGGTLPVLVKFLQSQREVPARIVSLLYALNTFGGMVGVILAAYIFIELFGLTNTLLIAALINLIIAFIANQIPSQDKEISQEVKENTSFSKLLTPQTTLVLSAFFVSGLISIAYQILWTRVLTPVLGTVIYAFASILVIYLFGIAFGSLVYDRFAKIIKNKFLAFALLEFGIGFFALLSVLLLHKFNFDRGWDVAIRILPATLLMGLTFPAVVALIEDKKSLGKIIGLSYFANTLGAIIGGFGASFFLIPTFGSSPSIAFLTIFNFLIALVFVFRANLNTLLKVSAIALSLIFVIATSWMVFYRTDRLHPNKLDFSLSEAKIKNMQYFFKEDEVATVFGFRNDKEKQEGLLIDGVATTHRVAETRVMAHLPITLHENPKRVLVIAFGMGTTFRSSLKQGMETDAVELVPSVPQAMYLFHPDAKEILSNPKGRVIINDGRNYAFLTDKKYDIVIIDPPPPFNTAGSTVLHSKEFYQDLAQKLDDDGIVSQWIYYDRSREDEISMAIKSFLEVFPYVVAIQKSNSVGGMFLEGSFKPIDAGRLNKFFEDEVTVADLREILGDELNINDSQFFEIIGDRESLLSELNSFPPITDDNPRSEYYLLRHYFTSSPELVLKDAQNFIEKLRSAYLK